MAEEEAPEIESWFSINMEPQLKRHPCVTSGKYTVERFTEVCGGLGTTPPVDRRSPRGSAMALRGPVAWTLRVYDRRLALGVRGTGAGRRLGALDGGGGYLPPPRVLLNNSASPEGGGAGWRRLPKRLGVVTVGYKCR